MIPLMTFCSLLASSLVRILIEVFSREMGLKSETETGLSILAKELHEIHLSFEDRLALHENQHRGYKNPA
jgi:hypothetical protein